MIRSVDCNGKTIKYELTRKKVKNINLRIKSDREINVVVSANSGVSVKYIDEFVMANSDKILIWLEEIEKNKNEKLNRIDENKICIVGESLNIVVEKGKNNVNKVNNNIIVAMHDVENIELKNKLLDKYINSVCEEVFLDIALEVCEMFSNYNIKMPTIRARNMKSRWGSCMPYKNIITMNKKLIHIPKSCIVYVMTHEFCHLVHPNHSKDFYALLSEIMPNWKEEKELLRKVGKYL